MCLLISCIDCSSVLAAAGDLASQLIIQLGKPGTKHFSWRSTVAFAAFGYVLQPVIASTLYHVALCSIHTVLWLSIVANE